MVTGQRGKRTKFMSDIRFKCSFCKQSLDAPEDMIGQLVDCPSCKNTIEVPFSRPKVEVKQQISRKPLLSRREEFIQRLNQPRDFPPGTSRVVLIVLVIIVLIGGATFAYNYWERRQNEAPIILAAKEALDEVHKMQSATKIGVNYQKYGDQLIVLSAKADNLLRAKKDLDVEHAYASGFGDKLQDILSAYKCAFDDWGFKITCTSKTGDAKQEERIREDWDRASEDVIQLDWEYAMLLGKDVEKPRSSYRFIGRNAHKNDQTTLQEPIPLSTGLFEGINSLLKKGDYYQTGEAVQQIKRPSDVLPELELMLTRVVNKNQALPVLSERAFFGINLGESLNNVKKRVETAGVITTNKASHSEGYYILGSIDGNKAIEWLEPSADDGADRVFRITAKMSDSSYESFVALEKELRLKYPFIDLSEYQQSPVQYIPNQAGRYNASINGQSVGIQLTYWGSTSHRFEDAKGVFIEYRYSSAQYLPWLEKTLRNKIAEGKKLKLTEAEKSGVSGSLRDAL